VWFGDRKPTSVQAVRFTTLCIDVIQPPERVLSSCSPEARYELRRAEACNGLVHEFVLHPCSSVLLHPVT
jgi:hypothetical protein